MRAIAFAVLIVSSALLMPAANSQDASTFYHSRYLLAGFLLRAGAVCGADSKRTIDAAFGLLNTSELKAVSKSYPDTTGQWMGEGAANFNNGVMKNGIGPTCAYAMTVRSQAEEIGKSSGSPPPAASSPSPSANSSPANKAFVECLLAQGRVGSYATSGPAFDGGKSVIMLMGQCKAQWDAWQNECIARGFTDGGPGGCTSKAYLVAFSVLKSLGK